MSHVSSVRKLLRMHGNGCLHGVLPGLTQCSLSAEQSPAGRDVHRCTEQTGNLPLRPQSQTGAQLHLTGTLGTLSYSRGTLVSGCECDGVKGLDPFCSWYSSQSPTGCNQTIQHPLPYPPHSFWARPILPEGPHLRVPRTS